MKKLYVMCGIPGSGKSTFLDNNKIFGNVVSRDKIRFDLISKDPEIDENNFNERYFSREKEVFNKYIEDIKYSLNVNYATVADATHLSIASRNRLFNALGSSLTNIEIIPIVFKTKLETALERNEKRRGEITYVPKSVIKRMSYQFDPPSIDEFDKMYMVDDDGSLIEITRKG